MTIHDDEWNTTGFTTLANSSVVKSEVSELKASVKHIQIA
jgi:hypothetical protein